MKKLVMLGATGAVGTEVVRRLSAMAEVERILLLNRRPFTALRHAKIAEEIADVLAPETYAQHLSGAEAAICTLGVGQPSKVSRADFLRIDRDAVLAFGQACKAAGVAHFTLLSSVGADAGSLSFFLRAKGELEEGLRALDFARLSLFHPSMILTPQNRYGLSQALILMLWPRLAPLLVGPLTKYRGIEVARLGRAMALNLRKEASGPEVLEWTEISTIAGSRPASGGDLAQ